MNKYDIVLREKPFLEGLIFNDVKELFEKLATSDEADEAEGYPIELEASCVESSAMGFITPSAADALDYDYVGSGLKDFISHILDDMGNKSEDCCYNFQGLSIYLDR